MNEDHQRTGTISRGVTRATDGAAPKKIISRGSSRLPYVALTLGHTMYLASINMSGGFMVTFFVSNFS